MTDEIRRTLSSSQAEALLRWSGETVGTAHCPVPVPDPACFYGLIGEVAREGSEGAETNPIAIAGNFIAYLSCAVGRCPHLAVGNSIHHPRLFFLHVGRSGRGRKGDALSLVMRIEEAVRRRGAELAPQIHRGGLSSREGLAALIHDGYRIGKEQVPAVVDKRLWVVESEFANVLQQSRRGGNTLSAALRDCWDGVDLKPATKTNRVQASRPHVCLCGAISPVELLALIQQRDLLNGFVNRFLVAWGERTSIEAFPRRATQDVVDELSGKVVDVVEFVRTLKDADDEGAMAMAAGARSRYAGTYQTELCPDLGSGIVDSLLERRAPMLLRLAMLFALTDCSSVIEERHVNAATAWIRYFTDSVFFVFAGGRPQATPPQIVWAARRIADFLARRGSASRRDLLVNCFGRHQPASVIDAAIAHLISGETTKIDIEVRARAPGSVGRSATIYRLRSDSTS